jgi:hypothetical protein
MGEGGRSCKVHGVKQGIMQMLGDIDLQEVSSGLYDKCSPRTEGREREKEREKGNISQFR